MLCSLIASVEIPDVHPATSLGYAAYLYTQMASNHRLIGHEISWDAENTKMAGSFTVDGLPGIGGTHLGVTRFENPGHGENVAVFYQTEGDDVTENVRARSGGQWASTSLSIPPN